MKDFVIRIAMSDTLISTFGYADTEESDGKLCLRHEGALAQGEIFHGFCNNGTPVYGDVVTIAVRPRTPPQMMTICEVHVYAVPLVCTYAIGLGIDFTNHVLRFGREGNTRMTRSRQIAGT